MGIAVDLTCSWLCAMTSWMLISSTRTWQMSNPADLFRVVVTCYARLLK